MGNAGKAGGALGFAVGSLVAKYYTGGIMGNGELDISESGAGPGGGLGGGEGVFGGIRSSTLELGEQEERQKNKEQNEELVGFLTDLAILQEDILA
jgi:hypothetical protein